VAEENWFFRLSAYQDHVEALIASDRLAIRPEPFRREALAFVRAGLADISVSRSVERARGWGIPVPDDPSQVVYVWFDALTNYISALGFGDPASPEYEDWWLHSDERVHVLGKGILRFHAVYWPAFLESAGQPAPTRIQVHPYLTVDGRKLSKSQGTTIDPVDVAERYGTDALRWFFARDIGEVADTDVTVDRLRDRANQDLAHALGNVTNRIAVLVHRFCAGGVGVGGAGAGLAGPLPEVAALEEEVRRAIVDFQLREATRLVIEAVSALNRYLEATEPWKIARDPGRGSELEAILGCCVDSARVIAAAVAPIVPELAERLVDQLGGGNGPRPEPTPAFARLE
jgi:methionyl-tRNA synthetase